MMCTNWDFPMEFTSLKIVFQFNNNLIQQKHVLTNIFMLHIEQICLYTMKNRKNGKIKLKKNKMNKNYNNSNSNKIVKIQI